MEALVLLINALAWPVATLGTAFLFRRELRMALGRLGQVKYGAMEMTFRDDLRQAESLAQAAGKLDPAPDPAAGTRVKLEVAAGDPTELAGTLVGREAPTATTVVVAAGSKAEPRPHRPLESYLRACQATPRLGVLEAWDDLQQAILHAATQLGDRRGGVTLRPESAVRFMVDRGWLNGAEGQLIERLRRLAELVDRGEAPPVSTTEARRFVALVVPLIERVVELVQILGPPATAGRRTFRENLAWADSNKIDMPTIIGEPC